LTAEQADFSFVRGEAFANPEISNEDATANAAGAFLRTQSFISIRHPAF
jgi:hypothetical protein